MARALLISTLPVLAMLAACGNGNRDEPGDITTTNTGDVVSAMRSPITHSAATMRRSQTRPHPASARRPCGVRAA